MSVKTEDVNAEAQEWERSWWGDCTTTFGEEAKQLTYAHRMGLVNEWRPERPGHWPVYDLDGRSVLDLGGGPVSILLKCVNGGQRTVVDPCLYPFWVKARYETAGILQVVEQAETFEHRDIDDPYDEAWIYNVLQHVEDPKAVIDTACNYALNLRIFEWIETETNVGHPHTLHADDLNRWIGGTGTVEQVNENGAVGLAYYGVFPL